jgi:hypothetical protein
MALIRFSPKEIVFDLNEPDVPAALTVSLFQPDGFSFDLVHRPPIRRTLSFYNSKWQDRSAWLSINRYHDESKHTS